MGPREILIILVIVLLLFGAPKLPQLARSLGQSLRILKDETRSLSDDSSAAPQQDGTDTAADPAASDQGKPATSSSDEPRDPQK